MIRGLLARRRGMRLPLVHKVEVAKAKNNPKVSQIYEVGPLNIYQSADGRDVIQLTTQTESDASTSPEQSQQVAQRSRWQAVLSEAGGISAALSEESMRRLKYCLQWLQVSFNLIFDRRRQYLFYEFWTVCNNAY
jgi:hypothetical protein